jgi:Phage endonuclease I
MNSFKSKLEIEVWKKLKTEFPNVKYEPDRIKFIQPALNRTYTPDFKTGRRKLYLEAKGKLDLDTRKKMIWFKECNPDVRIIFLFQNADAKITKRSKKTYGMWAEENGFEWLDYRKDWLSDYKKLCGA